MQRAGGDKGFIVGCELAKRLVRWVVIEDELQDTAVVRCLGGDGWVDGVKNIAEDVKEMPIQISSE